MKNDTVRCITCVIVAALISALLMMLAVTAAFAFEAPKIAELKVTNESLLTFLARLPFSFEAQIFYGTALFGAVGLLMNYIVKWMRNEIAGNLFDYLFRQNVRGTLLSYSTTIGVMIGAITAGAFETAGGDFVGWFNVMWLSLSNGFMWDSALNKGERPVWTPEQRAAKQ